MELRWEKTWNKLVNGNEETIEVCNATFECDRIEKKGNRMFVDVEGKKIKLSFYICSEFWLNAAFRESNESTSKSNDNNI